MDRGRDRDRDRRFDENRHGGESYRPSGRHSPRTDIHYARSPPRNRSPLRPMADTWMPHTSRTSGSFRSRSPDAFRRRSRSPFRGRDAVSSYNDRTRSPARRVSPVRNTKISSPRLSRRSRSPHTGTQPRSPRHARDRSPVLKRGRELSPPTSYRPSSPNRERFTSPNRTRYERPRSPPLFGLPRDVNFSGSRTRSRSLGRREGRREHCGEKQWRRKSPSPKPRSGHNSKQGSAATSRRSSPPIHANTTNIAQAGPVTRSPVYTQSRLQNEARTVAHSPPYHARSPVRMNDRTRAYSSQPSSPRRGPASQIPYPRCPEQSSIKYAEQEKEQTRNDLEQRQKPQDPVQNSQNGCQTSKLPPSNPQNFNRLQGKSPPSGPSGGSMSSVAHNRGGNASLLSAPTRPKGGSGPNINRDTRDTSWPGILSRRGPPPVSHLGPPTGPRANFSSVTSSHDPHRPPPFRHNNTSSTTYPRTQRFTNHLAGVPAVLSGGKLLPSGLDPGSEKRLAQLEADKERLLEQIAEKQKIKRAGLRDWDRLHRESATGALKSELAEGHLQRMTEGEGLGGSAAF